MSFIEGLHYKLTPKTSGTQYRTIWQLLHLDGLLLLSLFALTILSFLILYSASNQHWHLIMQAALHFTLATIVMFLLAQLPPAIYEKWTPLFFAMTLLLLIAVLLIGHMTKGAQRWLSLGVAHFQPSELMKIALPMMLAWFYTHRQLPPKMKELMISAAIILIPALLIIKEPDLGTGMMLILSGACVLLFAGISWRLVLLGMLMCLILLPIGWHFMHDYQQERLLTFLNPERDPLGAGYHLIQSKIAIGSGGLFGKGWLVGTQARLNFLPEHTTDFIFAVSGEEFGFVGSITLLVIYLCIIARCFYIASCAQDTYTRLLAGGFTLMFFLSVFINIGMVSGILPIVGIPLPLISYGGSSMITTMAIFGILMSIRGHQRLLPS